MRAYRKLVDIRALESLPENVRERLSLGIEKISLDIERYAKENIQRNGQIDTGNMLNSVKAQMTASLTAEVIVGAEYGVFQELGTVKMGGRPFLGPAVDFAREDFERMIGQAIEQAARDGGGTG